MDAKKALLVALESSAEGMEQHADALELLSRESRCAFYSAVAFVSLSLVGYLGAAYYTANAYNSEGARAHETHHANQVHTFE